MEKFFLYARKSTEDDDRQILSIDSQIKELSKTAEKGSLEISDILTEAKSAKAPGRPVFNEMLRRLKKGEAQGILCWKLDRLSRNPIDTGELLWAMKTLGVKIITPGQTFSQENNSTLLAYFEYGTAQYFIEELSKNVKRGLNAKVEAGWRPGRAPLGYLNRKELEKGKKDIVRDPELFPLIRQMWDLMLSGDCKPPQILEIANNQWGFRTRKFKRMGDKPLSLSTLYKILNNPFYAGWLPYNGELYRGSHEPMVSQAEFDRAQELLGRTDSAKPKRHHFAFTGLIHCGECGCLITAENKQKVNKGNGHVHRYTYYHCTKRKRNRPCSERCLEVKEMEKQIGTYLEKIVISSRFKDWAVKYLQEGDKLACLNREERRASLQAAIEKTGRQMKNLLQMRCRDLLSDEEYLKEKAGLLQEKQRLAEKLEKEREKKDVSVLLTEQTLTFAQLAQYWFQRGAEEDKRTILSAIGSNLILKDRKLQIQAKKPFVILAGGLEKIGQDSERLEPLKIGLDKEKGATSFAPISVMSG